jgi:hypothetical protein
VPKGQVWATENAVVAASNGVQFLGGTELLAAVVTPPQPGLPISDLDHARLAAQKYASEYPHAATLFLIAVEILTRGVPKQPAVTPSYKPIVRSVSGCSPRLDQPSKSVTPNKTFDLALSLSCAKSCAAEPTPEVTGTVELWRDRRKAKESQFKVTVPAGWCTAKALDTAVFDDRMMQQYDVMIDDPLDADLETARLTEDKIDTYAQYALGGGKRGTAYLELAQLLGKPYNWRGFFWNHVPVPASVCGTVDVANVEQEGDKLAVQRSYTSALRWYQLAVACEPRVVLKAYTVACRAHDWTAAKLYYWQYPGRSAQIADTCVREGFDPRTP